MSAIVEALARAPLARTQGRTVRLRTGGRLYPLGQGYVVLMGLDEREASTRALVDVWVGFRDEALPNNGWIVWQPRSSNETGLLEFTAAATTRCARLYLSPVEPVTLIMLDEIARPGDTVLIDWLPPLDELA